MPECSGWITRRVLFVMMIAPAPRWIGTPDRRLLANWHASVAPLRMTLVICPPFFHERVVSYRLFALVAARLAAIGIDCLRFDYYGTGDSDGEDEQFSLAGASADIEQAIVAARSFSSSDSRVSLLGVRAGGWAATDVAAVHPDLSQCWLWQPLESGEAYLNTLHRIDDAERATRAGEPFYRSPSSHAEDGQLMGCAFPAALQNDLMAARLGASELDMPCGVLDERKALEQLDSSAPQIELHRNETQWTDSLKVRATFLTRELREAIDQLAVSIMKLDQIR